MASLPLKPTAARPEATVGVGSLLVGQVTQAHRDQLNGLECGCECVCEVGEFGGARIAHLAGAAARLLKAGYCGVDRSAVECDARIADRAAEVRDPVCGWRRLRCSSLYLYEVHVTKLSMGWALCPALFVGSRNLERTSGIHEFRGERARILVASDGDAGANLEGRTQECPVAAAIAQ
jgi:hypothetical protein